MAVMKSSAFAIFPSAGNAFSYTGHTSPISCAGAIHFALHSMIKTTFPPPSAALFFIFPRRGISPGISCPRPAPVFPFYRLILLRMFRYCIGVMLKLSRKFR